MTATGFTRMKWADLATATPAWRLARTPEGPRQWQVPVRADLMLGFLAISTVATLMTRGGAHPLGFHLPGRHVLARVARAQATGETSAPYDAPPEQVVIFSSTLCWVMLSFDVEQRSPRARISA